MARQISFTAALDSASQRKEIERFKAETKETFPVEIEKLAIFCYLSQRQDAATRISATSMVQQVCHLLIDMNVVAQLYLPELQELSIKIVPGAGRSQLGVMITIPEPETQPESAETEPEEE